MTTNTSVYTPPRSHSWRGPAVSLLVFTIAIGVMLRFIHLNALLSLLASANLWWLAAAVACKLLGPFVTAIVYDRVLSLLGYRLNVLSFWLVAQVAIWVNGALPAGPVVMSALLLRVFNQRGIPEGATTVAVVLDTFTYQAAFFGVFAAAIVYLLMDGASLSYVFGLVGLFALILIMIAAYLWLRHSDRARITKFLVRVQHWLAQRLHRRWKAASVERFVDQLAQSVACARDQPWAIARLVLYQLTVIGLDILTLSCTFRALGYAPPLFNMLLSTTLGAIITGLAPLPGGGGTFEATLVLNSVRAGAPQEVAVGATVIYRILTFWLPLLLTAATYRRLLGPDEVGAEPLIVADPEQPS